MHEEYQDEESRIVVERLSDLGEWEFYRFSDEDTDEVVCKIALRVDLDKDQIEYGVWRKEEADPAATGYLDREDTREWGAAKRKQALQEIADEYEEGLPETRNGIEFFLGEIEEDDEDNDDDHFDDDDDDGDDEEDE